jgi:cyclopropane fatty-acyl-phospholipid synthase-like methyltransferase
MTKDHFGGLANDTLAKCAGISPGARVADFCAGLGGAARYYAVVLGADVTGIELTPARRRRRINAPRRAAGSRAGVARRRREHAAS